MGNKEAKLNMYFADNRYGVGTSVQASLGIKEERSGNIVTYTMPDNYGPFNEMRFIASQEPQSLGGQLFFKVISIDPSTRSITCAFVDNNNNVRDYRETGKYATYRVSDNWFISGIITITFGNKASIPKSIDPFRYIVPSVRSLPSLNSTIDNEGVIRYNGQITLTPDLKQIEYLTLTDMSNNNGQYMLDIRIDRNINNGSISINYNNTFCPNVVNVIYENKNITLVSNTIIPNMNVVTTTKDCSLGIPTNPDLYLVRINDNRLMLTLRNSSIENLMSLGTYTYISLLLLPILN